MEKKSFAIIEIGSNNTKTHIYEGEDLIYENNTTIEFKKNYLKDNQINQNDFKQLCSLIQKAFEYTQNVHVYGCSIFRNIKAEELEAINANLEKQFHLSIEVVSQEEEATYTAYTCYNHVNYDGNLCVFIGGGGSIELLLIENGMIKERKYYSFGVVDITQQFRSLKNDIPECTFEEVYDYVQHLMNDLTLKADILILAGGDHLYWYNNAGYQLLENTLYKDPNQKYMIPIEMSDQYDKDALITSLDKIRKHSDNPIWFDGSRAMKVITNFVSHQIGAKYIIPTKINMEDGIRDRLK